MKKTDQDYLFGQLKSLIQKNTTSEMAFDQFRQYYNQKQDLFTNEIKVQLMEIASTIASSFNRNNKSELVFLSRLQILLARQ